uniref:Putative LOC101741534 [Bombyx mori] n=1 Tax=Lepeophtheirus salmonis TaxID=72036 RepID=A0A0K2T3F5_LEPSM
MHYDPALPLFLTTDVSPIGLEAVLSQLDEDMERLVAFASRKLSTSEANYSHIDKEAMAIIFRLLIFEKYEIGRKFIIRTDHRPLQYIFNPGKELPPVVSTRLSRLDIKLSMFDIIYHM